MGDKREYLPNEIVEKVYFMKEELVNPEPNITIDDEGNIGSSAGGRVNGVNMDGESTT